MKCDGRYTEIAFILGALVCSCLDVAHMYVGRSDLTCLFNVPYSLVRVVCNGTCVCSSFVVQMAWRLLAVLGVISPPPTVLHFLPHSSLSLPSLSPSFPSPPLPLPSPPLLSPPFPSLPQTYLHQEVPWGRHPTNLCPVHSRATLQTLCADCR